MNARCRRPLALGLVVAAPALLAAPAPAQRKPAAPPPEQVPADRENRPESWEPFIDAYRRAGAPRLLITTIIVPAPGSEGGPAGDLAIADRFSGRIVGFFTASPEVHVVNLAAQDLARTGEWERLRRNDEPAAAKALAEKAGADVVVLVRMLGQRDGTYAATCVVMDNRRGQTLDQHSWDMYPDDRGGWGAGHMARYAWAVADRVMRRFDLMYPREAPAPFQRDALGSGPRPFTVRVIADTAFDTPIRLRRVIRDVPGVIEVGGYEEERINPGRSMISFETRYQGDPVDLQFEIMLGAREELGLELAVVGAADGRLTLRAEPEALPELLLSGGPETARNRAARQALRNAYAGEQKPRIAVMINEAAGEDPGAELRSQLELAGGKPAAPDAPVPAAGQGAAPNAQGGISIVVSPTIDLDQRQNAGDRAPGADDRDRDRDRFRDRDRVRDRVRRAEAAELAALDTEMMENEVCGRLRELGLIPVNTDQARKNLTRDQDLAGRSLNDSELAWLLSRQLEFDIVVSGAGRVIRHRQPPVLRYTFRAFRVQDAEGLAFATVEREIEGGNVAAATAALASEAVGRLAAQLMDSWKPPRSLEVQVAGCETDGDVYAIMDVLEDRFSDSIVSCDFLSHESGRAGGLGRFRIEHRGDPDSLVRQFHGADGLPFTLDSRSSTRERLTVRINRKFAGAEH